MKHLLTTAALLAIGAVAVGCSSETTVDAPTPKGDGLTIDEFEESYVSGSYVAGDHEIQFEATARDGYTSIRVTLPDGTESMRMDMTGKAEEDFQRWHYGVRFDPNVDVTTQDAAMQWLDSEEIQLFASIWREVSEAYPDVKATAAGDTLVRYSIHLDEVVGMDRDPNNELGAHGTTCFGACGPGCISVNTGWSYCYCHDNCCSHNGWGACFSWCYWSANDWCWQ